MPYIKEQRRREINVGQLAHQQALGAGELNYAITRLLIKYVENRGLGYQTINDVRGAVDGAKLEFERRVAFPYEDKAIARNGDVYPKEMTQ